jgi:polysaccharide biosynthesis protein PelG
LEMIYLSAVKNYKSILKGFLAGNIIEILMIILIGSIPDGWKIQYVFLCFNTGFTVTAGFLMYQISIFFGEGTGGVTKWAGYIKKFPSLFMTGLFYSLGFYFLYINYRFSSGEIFVQGFMALKPEFDLPFFWAALGIIPGLVYFSTRLETALYMDSRELYLKINNNGTGAEIDYCTQNVVSTVKYYCIKLALVQAIVMLFMLLIPFATMEITKTVYVFWMLTVGLCATLFMYAVILVVLYFDGKGYALMISFIYMSLNIILTLFFNHYVAGLIGFGFMAGSVISMIISIILLMIFMANLKNYIFIMK